tara:strand:- start:6153 stop:6878 length:726 start_codon:yes stop_codon:yes gene_type:complete
MERKPIRKFKRTIKKKKEYGDVFKKQMDICNFKTKDFFLDDIENDIEILCIKESELTKQIISLPKEIQKKLYILAMRNYWKYTAMNTIYRPMYYDYYSYVEKEKGKVYYDNIHFMHLEFNTLESTKEWIPGCQCDFCLNENHPKYTKEYKQSIYDKMLEEYDMEEFHKCIHCYDLIPNYWNTHLKYHISVNLDENFQYSFLSHKIYDPLKTAECSVYDKIKDQDSPIYFSDEIISQYASQN